MEEHQQDYQEALVLLMRGLHAGGLLVFPRARTSAMEVVAGAQFRPLMAPVLLGVVVVLCVAVEQKHVQRQRHHNAEAVQL